MRPLHSVARYCSRTIPDSFGHLLYGRGNHSVRPLADPHRLAATVPKNWSPDPALKEAYQVIAEHTREYYPEKYAEWLATQSTSPCPEILTLLIRFQEATVSRPNSCHLRSSTQRPQMAVLSELSDESDSSEEPPDKGAAELIVFV